MIRNKCPPSFIGDALFVGYFGCTSDVMVHIFSDVVIELLFGKISCDLHLTYENNARNQIWILWRSICAWHWKRKTTHRVSLSASLQRYLLFKAVKWKTWRKGSFPPCGMWISKKLWLFNVIRNSKSFGYCDFKQKCSLSVFYDSLWVRQRRNGPMYVARDFCQVRAKHSLVI